MPDQIKLRDTEFVVDADLLAKANQATLMIHNNHGKLVTIGHPKIYLPGGKINKGELPIDAVKRIAQQQLHVSFDGYDRYLHPIFVDYIGHKSNNHIALCFAVFDKDDRTLVHDCRIVTDAPSKTKMSIGTNSLGILSMGVFTQFHKYYAALQKSIVSNPVLQPILEPKHVH